MIKLKNIISQLDPGAYQAIEGLLVKNKADNMLYLLQSYKKGKQKDEEVMEHLGLNSNAFYVLKSRLHDKIENHFSNNTDANMDVVISQLQQIPDVCFNTPREIAVIYLQKLEKDLLPHDMHNELLMVYAALKKIYLYSDRYFYYSQLYNKHVALGLSLEKSEEILGNFNRLLTQYYFSRSAPMLDELMFLRKKILDQYALNSSGHIAIIKNFIELQLVLFCNTPISNDYDIEGAFQATAKIFNELPPASPRKSWKPVLDFLYFEYYKKTGQQKPMLQYYEKTNDNIAALLLYNSICHTARFLMSKVKLLQDFGRTADLAKAEVQVMSDPEDPYSGVLYSLYKSMSQYHAGHIKEAISMLNGSLNDNSFKDYFHMNMEIKFTLMFFYIQIEEFDIADSMLKSIYRKIKSENLEMYSHALDLIKVFGLDISVKGGKKNAKQRDSFTLFQARNTGEYELLPHLQSELKKKYI